MVKFKKVVKFREAECGKDEGVNEGKGNVPGTGGGGEV